jgi:hypothetical protein
VRNGGGRLGETGVGKTHLAVAPAVKAVEAGYSALFLTLESLMTRLVRAKYENRLERALQQLSYPKLLIVDEVGYLPLSREEVSLFFRLVVRRYERASLIVTSNKSFLDWGEIFNDQVLATAILDRLLHYSTTLNIKGESYRLKEKCRAGLLGRPKPADRRTRGGARRTRRPLKNGHSPRRSGDFLRLLRHFDDGAGLGQPTEPGVHPGYAAGHEDSHPAPS